MNRWKRAARVAALIAIAGCTADGGGIAGPSGDPAHTISDAAHAGAVPGFYFLPPMVRQPAYAGTFDAGLAPRVEICALTGSDCTAVIAEFPGVPVSMGTEQYAVNWHTNDYALDPAVTYRISVYAGAVRLGFADVDVVSSGRELKNVDTGEYIALLDGRTLPIKFRVETGIVGLVTVSPAADTVAVGGTAQFTATLADLHGNPLPGPAVTWATSDSAVATIDGNGLATGIGPGTVTVTASVGYLDGTASLTVEQPNEPPVAAADTFDAIGNFSTPVAAPGVLANDTDPDADALSAVAGTYATANGGTVTLAADGGFTFLSAAGFTGEDSFDYVATDGIDSVTATVSMSVPTRVWYADNAATAPGDGRDASPFAALADAQAASAPGETVFVRYGDGTSTGYDAGFVFQDGQTLTGQGIASDVTATLNGQSVVLLAAGGTPTITRGAPGATVALAQNVTLQGVRIESTAGAGITGGNFGTFTAGAVTVAATGGPALELANGTAAAAFGALSSAGSAGAGLRLVGVSGTLSAPAGSISGSAGAGVEIAGGDAVVTYGGDVAVLGPRPASVTGRTGGSVTLSGALASTGQGILVQGNTGGAIAFTGASKTLSTGANTAVELANNTGAAISFGGGGLVMSTTAGAGFDASGGGTVTVTGAGNSASSAGGVAVRVVNTTIGAAGLSFRSVSATGGPNGIVLENTGALNGLQVTGGGAAGSGGALRASSGDAVRLDDVVNVRLSWMDIEDNLGSGIAGTGVSGFAIEDSRVLRNGDDAAAQEAGLSFNGLQGTARIAGTTVGASATENLRVVNGSGVLDRLEITGSTFQANDAVTGTDGLLLTANGSAVLNATVQSSSFGGARGSQLRVSLGGTAVSDIVLAGNTFANTHPATASGGGGVVLETTDGTPALRYEVINNDIRGALGSALVFSEGAGVSTMAGTTSGNVIGAAGLANSGSAQGSGITVISIGGGSHTTAVTGNEIRQYNNHGLLLQIGDNSAGGNGALNATITGNTIAEPGTALGSKNGIHLNAGVITGDDPQVCVDVGGAGALENSLAGAGSGGSAGTDFRLRQRFLTAVQLPGYAGANNDNAAVVAYVQARNTGTPTGLAQNTVSTGGAGFVGGAACPQP